MELKKGTLLQGGKYRIIKKLGQGSFGITYLALTKYTIKGSLGEMGVEANVAIKEFFMSDVNTRSADGSTVEGSNGSVFTNYRNKFKKEAENLLKLDHPSIVKVQDVFDENGTTYYSMEYVDGGNLDDYISKNNPIDEKDAISIIRSICNALAFMHDKKMLHLDLKPKNIMRSLKGEIYLIDFGLSKQFTDNGEPESSTNIGKGTPGYAPLEQAKLIKDGTFPATLDIYALGATMYKILTGKQPLDASDILNISFPKDLLIKYNRSNTLIGIIEICMSPKKKDRFQKVSDVLGLLPYEELVSYKVRIENSNCYILRKVNLTDKIPVIKPEQGELPLLNTNFTYGQVLNGEADSHIIATIENDTIVLSFRFPKEKRTFYFKFYDGANELPIPLIRPILVDSNGTSMPISTDSFTFHGKEIYGRKTITSSNPEYTVDSSSSTIDLQRFNNGATINVYVEKCWLWQFNPSVDNRSVIIKPINIILFNKYTGEQKVLTHIIGAITQRLSGTPQAWEMRIDSDYYESICVPINSPYVLRPKSNEDSAYKNKLNSRFGVFLDKFSENGTMWHDLKLTIGLVLVGVGIMFALMNGVAGKSYKKTNANPNQSEYHQYYQTHSAEIDSLMTKTALEVFEKQSK